MSRQVTEAAELAIERLLAGGKAPSVATVREVALRSLACSEEEVLRSLLPADSDGVVEVEAHDELGDVFVEIEDDPWFEPVDDWMVRDVGHQALEAMSPAYQWAFWTAALEYDPDSALGKAVTFVAEDARRQVVGSILDAANGAHKLSRDPGAEIPQAGVPPSTDYLDELLTLGPKRDVFAEELGRSAKRATSAGVLPSPRKRDGRRRLLGPAFASAEQRRAPGHPPAERIVATIRASLNERAAEHGFTLSAFTARPSRGKPPADVVSRLNALAAAVSELVEAGVAQTAIAEAIDWPKPRLSELVRRLPSAPTH